MPGGSVGLYDEGKCTTPDLKFSWWPPAEDAA